MSNRDDLLNSTGNEALRHLARVVGGDEAPVPTSADLGAWLPHSPTTEHGDADKRLKALFGAPSAWHFDRLDDTLELVAMVDGPLEPGMKAMRNPDGTYRPVDVHAFSAVHDSWRVSDPCPRHPAAPLVAAWQRWKAKQPRPERAIDTDDIPSVLLPRSIAAVDEHAPGYYLSRFNQAAHRAADGQLMLGFEHPEMSGPTLPANIWTLQLAEGEKRGRGLPAALRAFVAAIVHVPLHARRVTGPTDPPVVLQAQDGGPFKLRHFLPMVYSGRTRPGEYWHVLHGVRAVLHSEAADVPYEWNGRLWTRSVVRMDGIPEGAYETAMLDEPWPVAVWLPPGEGTGAAISWALLLHLMCRDPAAARLLINLSYRWHVEGKRLHPAPGGKHWLYRRDPKAYDRFTDHEADLYCFPPGTGNAAARNRRIEGWAAVERLIKLGGAVSVDGRLLPPQVGQIGPNRADVDRAESDVDRAESDVDRAGQLENC